MSGQITKNQINLDPIEIFQFCGDSPTYVKLLKIDLDLIKIIQFLTFWTFLLKSPQSFAVVFL